jgi:hypothetical protein
MFQMSPLHSDPAFYQLLADSYARLLGYETGYKGVRITKTGARFECWHGR